MIEGDAGPFDDGVTVAGNVFHDQGTAVIMMAYSICLVYAGCNVHVFGKCDRTTNELKNGEETSLSDGFMTARLCHPFLRDLAGCYAVSGGARPVAPQSGIGVKKEKCQLPTVMARVREHERQSRRPRVTADRRLQRKHS